MALKSELLFIHPQQAFLGSCYVRTMRPREHGRKEVGRPVDSCCVVAGVSHFAPLSFSGFLCQGGERVSALIYWKHELRLGETDVQVCLPREPSGLGWPPSSHPQACVFTLCRGLSCLLRKRLQHRCRGPRSRWKYQQRHLPDQQPKVVQKSQPQCPKLVPDVLLR